MLPHRTYMLRTGCVKFDLIGGVSTCSVFVSLCICGITARAYSGFSSDFASFIAVWREHPTVGNGRTGNWLQSEAGAIFANIRACAACAPELFAPWSVPFATRQFSAQCCIARVRWELTPISKAEASGSKLGCIVLYPSMAQGAEKRLSTSTGVLLEVYGAERVYQ